MKAERYQNRAIYYSDLIVHKDSKLKSIKDLKGEIFVFNEEISNSGYNMPRAFFIRNKIGKGFFGKILRSGSHEESIKMVARGEADYSFIDSLVLDYDRHNKESHALKVRVIKEIGPAGIPPVVVSKKLSSKLTNKIRAILLGMNKDKEGRRILDSALLSHFARVKDQDYDSIRDDYSLAKEHKALTIKK